TIRTISATWPVVSRASMRCQAVSRNRLPARTPSESSNSNRTQTAACSMRKIFYTSSVRRNHRQGEERGVRAVVMDRVATHQRRMIGMREYAVGRRRVAIGEFKPDAVVLLENVSDRQHLDVELIDFAGLERLRIGVGVERPLRL